MNEQRNAGEPLSLWWKMSLILVLVACFGVLIWIASKSYKDAAPIPEKVVGPAEEVVFTGEDIVAGQQIFLKYGLMENGTIWGHGAYLGPDFSAEYLHTLVLSAWRKVARQRNHAPVEKSAVMDRKVIDVEVERLLKENRYNPGTKTLLFTHIEAASYHDQLEKWTAYLSKPVTSAGLPKKYITDPRELQQLTAFFAWTAWASAVHRPGKNYSYTNNFPYDPEAGKRPTERQFFGARSVLSPCWELPPQFSLPSESSIFSAGKAREDIYIPR